MFDMIFAMIAIAANLQPATQDGQGAPTGRADGDVAVFVAEDQTPTGRFTTATEVRPIMEATKANWIGVREYGGNDLLYLTHLWSWRCGLLAVKVGINEAPPQAMPLPECHLDYASPNSILDTDGLPYVTYPLSSVQQVTVEIIYDDLTKSTTTYGRNEVRIP